MTLGSRRRTRTGSRTSRETGPDRCHPGAERLLEPVVHPRLGVLLAETNSAMMKTNGMK